MLAVRPTRNLIYRGIATSAIRKDLINYASPEKNDSNQIKYMEHPNRNLEYFETAYYPFPLSPRFADKDAFLNELRAKSMGDWAAITPKEAKNLYDGHFRCPLHAYSVPDDKWKLWFGIWGIQLVALSLIFRLYQSWFQLEHPEYANSEAYIHEMMKKKLQTNNQPFQGITSHYNYVDGEYVEKNFLHKYLGFFAHFNLSPRDPKDGTQMGFTYLNKE